MFKADDYRLKIKALGATLEETAEALDIGGLTSQLAALKAEQEDPEVWQDLERSKKIGREVSSVESKIASYEKSKKAVDDVNEVIDLVEETGEEVFERIMRINVKVPYFLTQAALPYLRRSKSASVINISSVVGHAGYPLQSAYAASKHAVLGFTKSLAAEVYGEGIRVHAISPGGVYTDMVKVARPDLSPEGMILPEEIAEIVLFFLANRGNAVVDEILVHRVNKTPFLI